MPGVRGKRAAKTCFSAKLQGLTKWQSKVFRFQPRVFGDAGKHPGPDFFRVMEGPGEFTLGRVGKLDM
jgi:hypothetical protein